MFVDGKGEIQFRFQIFPRPNIHQRHTSNLAGFLIEYFNFAPGNFPSSD